MVLHFALKSTSELSHILDPSCYHLRIREVAIASHILCANHQLHAQALPIFYACNTFRFVISPNREHFAIEEENLPAWILNPAPHQLAYIRKMHIEVVSNCCVVSQSIESFVGFVLEAIKRFSNLATLKVTVLHRQYGNWFVPYEQRMPDCVRQVRDLFAGTQPLAEITSREMDSTWSEWDRMKYVSRYASKALQRSVAQEGRE